jgi:adenosine kinase
MPIMSQADLTVLMAGAACLAVNEHEATMLETSLQTTVAQLSNTLPVLVTLGDKGLAFWEHGISTRVPAITVNKPIDPTGCGDSFRGAWLHGLTLGWSMLDALRLGNLMGAHKVAHQGAQGYHITINGLKDLWGQHYTQAWPSAKAG